MTDERDLVARCVLREPEAWAALVRGCDRRVRQVVARCGAPEEVEDLGQEVWARLLTQDAVALRGFRGASPRSLGAFIGSVARAVAIDHLRARASRPPASGGEAPEVLADTSPTPEGAASAQEERRRLARALDAALRDAERPGRDADILRLHFEHGLSASEISAAGIGLEPRGVEAVLRRVKERIEQLLRADDKP